MASMTVKTIRAPKFHSRTKSRTEIGKISFTAVQFRPWKRVFQIIFGSHPNLFVRFFVPTFHTEYDNMLSFPRGNIDENESKEGKEMEEKNLIDCV